MKHTLKSRAKMSKAHIEHWSQLPEEEKAKRRQQAIAVLRKSPRNIPMVWRVENPTDSTLRRRARLIMKDEPKFCYFCDATPAEAPEKKRWQVHHLDGDESNNARENLSWSHMKCHRRYHIAMNPPAKGVKHTAKTRKKWSETRKGRTFTEKHRRHLSEARREWWRKRKLQLTQSTI